MRVNYDLVKRWVRIERVVILRGDLWPDADELPSQKIRPWIDDQHNCGIWICLVRESAIAAEPDLLCEFGIYGERATGIQELDEQSRTVRFILSFDQQSIKLARDRLARLALYATPYADLLNAIGPPRGSEG